MDTKAIRRECMMNQTELGHLLGVDGMTVSKWERGLTKPSAWRRALITELEKSPRKADLKLILNMRGAPSALAQMLSHCR